MISAPPAPTTSRPPDLARDRTGLVPLAALHVGLTLAWAAVALLDAPAKGWAVLGVVVAYNVALPLTARSVGRLDVLALWAFLLPLSLFQLLPDWVLADLVGSIRFPDTGGPRAGDAIPLAMAGMWVAPLLISVALARDSAWRAAGLALAIFTGSELVAPLLDVWEPTDATTQLAGVALYVLPAEALLGAATLLAFRWTTGRPRSEKVAVAAGVSTLYLGALVLAHFLLDVAELRIAI